VKFFADNVMWIGLAIGSAFMLLLPSFKRNMGAVAGLSATEAVLLINRSNAIVIDVREATEFASGHIADAKNIPLKELPDRHKELAKFVDKPILVNCQGGVRSSKACNILVKAGFNKVSNLDGGINAWVQAKLPVVKE